MATKGDSEGFVSSPLEGHGARHKDSYFPVSHENTAKLRYTDAEFKRLKADFLRIARNRRPRDFSRSESSRSLSPVRLQPQRRSTNLLKFKNRHVLLNRRGVVVQPNRNTIRITSDYGR